MAARWAIVFIILGVLNKLKADRYHEDTEVEQLLKFFDDREIDRFSATNCHLRGSENLPLVLNELNVEPFHLQLGKKLYLNVSFYLDQVIGANGNRIEISLSLGLKTPWGHTEMCEIIGDELCHTNDLCQYLKYFKNCPRRLPSCYCPLKQGNYSLTNLPIPTKKLPVDINGTFDITIKIKEQGKHIGCIDAHVCMGRCKPQLFYYPP